MDQSVYFSLRKQIFTEAKQFYLCDACIFTGGDIEQKVSKEAIHFEDDIYVLKAIDVVARIKLIHPNTTVHSIGPVECSVYVKHKKPHTALLISKLLIICAVLFFGGAFAIMTFHEDVSMRSVHAAVYAFFTGIESEYVPIVSIPYSIGIVIGFITLFGLFKKKRKTPTVLDLDIEKHETAMRDYLTERSSDDDG